MNAAILLIQFPILYLVWILPYVIHMDIRLKYKEHRRILKKNLFVPLIYTLIIFIVDLVIEVPLLWSVIGSSLVLSICAMAWHLKDDHENFIVYRDEDGTDDENNEDAPKHKKTHKVLVHGKQFLNRNRTGKLAFIIFVAYIICISVFSAVIFAWFSGVDNGEYLNTLITYENGNQLFKNGGLPIYKIPLISEDAANAIATSHIGDFGGSTQIADSEQITYHAFPYWIFNVEPLNNFGVPHTLGYVLVNATDGNYSEIFQQNSVAPELWFYNEIGWHTYLSNAEVYPGNWYPQPLDNKTVVYVQTVNGAGPEGNMYSVGGVVYNPDGSIRDQYYSLASAPSYVSQPYDKELLQMLAGQWGDYRVGQNSFSPFAGGFLTIPASQYRLDLSGDTELVPYENSTAFMQFMSPANAPNSLGSVMIAVGSHIYVYNIESMNMISSNYAQTTIQGKLPALSSGSLQTSNPILYPIGQYYAWIVPYYYNSGSIVQLQGLGIIDASDATHLVLETSPSSTLSASGIIDVRNKAVDAFLNSTISPPPSQNATKIYGTVTNKLSWTENGSTEIALQINNTSWYSASAASLSYSQWIELEEIQVGQQVNLLVNGNTIVKIL